MVTKVQAFLDEIGARRPAGAEAAADGQPALLLPITLQLEAHKDVAREQLLWRLGDTKAVPAIVARTFAQQHVQQPMQLEREVARLTKDLEKVLEQHKDLAAAPPSPTLVKLKVRCSLPNLGALFLDEPLWDLGAPRAACEAYISCVCNDLGLDWAAHTLIMRKMKDAIDAAARDWAAGKAEVLPIPTGAALHRSPPGRQPQVVFVSKQQVEAMQEALAQRGVQQGVAAAAGGGAVTQDGGGEAAAAVMAELTEGGMQQHQQQRQQAGSDSDMPDLPMDDE